MKFPRIALYLLLIILFGGWQTSQAAHPNIIYILADDMYSEISPLEAFAPESECLFTKYRFSQFSAIQVVSNKFN